jgi:hypothetical protein
MPGAPGLGKGVSGRFCPRAGWTPRRCLDPVIRTPQFCGALASEGGDARTADRKGMSDSENDPTADGGRRDRQSPRLRPETQAGQAAREQRLAEQLRANLKKRKRQQRARRAGAAGDPPDGGPDGAPDGG